MNWIRGLTHIPIMMMMTMMIKIYLIMVTLTAVRAYFVVVAIVMMTFLMSLSVEYIFTRTLLKDNI